MTITEAIEQLQSFISNYENDDIKNYMIKKYGNLSEVEQDYIATKILINTVYILNTENIKLKEIINKYKNYNTELI